MDKMCTLTAFYSFFYFDHPQYIKVFTPDFKNIAYSPTWGLALFIDIWLSVIIQSQEVGKIEDKYINV